MSFCRHDPSVKEDLRYLKGIRESIKSGRRILIEKEMQRVCGGSLGYPLIFSILKCRIIRIELSAID